MVRARLLVVVFGSALLVTACSGQSTPAPSTSAAPTTTAAPSAVPGALPGNQVENAVESAFQGATAVHIKGSLTNNSGSLTLDLQLNRNKSAQGTVNEGGADIPLKAVNGVDYLQFTPQLISVSSNKAVEQAGAALTDKWVVGTSSLASDIVGSLKGLLDYDTFLQSMFATGSLTPTATTTDVVDNVPVVVYEASDGASVYVATASPHYLMRLTAPSSGSGSLDFTNWNKPVAVTAPTGAQLYAGPGA
jgi:hypothetical protein